MVGGLLTLLPAVAYQAFFKAALIAGPLSEAPEAVRQEASRAAARLADLVFVPLLIEAVIVMALGLGLIVWYAVTRPRGTPAAPAATPSAKPAG